MFILTADLHLKIWNDVYDPEHDLPKRLVETVNVVDQMCKYAIEHGIDTIVIAGDLNDLKDVIHTKAFVFFAKEIIERYYNLHFVLLHGNHDSASALNYYSSVELLSGYKNVTTVTDYETEIIPGVCFVPYGPEMVTDIKVGAEAGCKILISHMGLTDAVLSSGISIRSRLKSDDLKDFSLVLLGHYHKPQQVNHVYYVGSPIQLRFDEKNDEKRFLVVDPIELKVESIETIGYRKHFEFIAETPEELKEIKDRATQLITEGHHVKIKTKFELSKVKRDIKKLSTLGIRISDEYQPERIIRGITSGMDIRDQMKKYLEIANIDESLHEKYLQVGLEAITDEPKKEESSKSQSVS